jgi:hypothetical protein
MDVNEVGGDPGAQWLSESAPLPLSPSLAEVERLGRVGERLRVDADAARARWIVVQQEGRKFELVGAWCMGGCLLLIGCITVLGAVGERAGWW